MWQVVGRGEVAVGRSQRLPRVGHSQIQHTYCREQLSPSAKPGTLLGKHVQEREHQSQRKVEEEHLHGTADIPCRPWRMPEWSTRIFLKELKPVRVHIRADVMRKKAERHHYVLAVTPLPFSMWACMAGVGYVRNRAEPGGRGRKGVLLWVCFSLPELILVGNKLPIFFPKRVHFACNGNR